LGRHLSAFGIVPLTGEACGLSYRLLCDVTVQGKKTLEKALDVAQLHLHENWNSGDQSDPHIGSILLPPDGLVFLAVFALLENGCREVWLTKSGCVIGVEADDTPDQVESLKRCQGDNFIRRFGYFGTARDRNRHVMSGRIH
jgi:hypothetical protein